MPPTPVLATQRLALRPLSAQDVPAIQRRFPRWEIVRYLDAKVPWPYPADGAARYVANCLASMARGDRSHWAIVPRRGPQEAIGLIGLKPDDGVCFSQCGFWIDPEFQGRGLMREALDKVTHYAFDDLDWPHLWSTNAQENHPSRRIKEQQGARLVDLVIGRHVGGETTHMVWLLTRESWAGTGQRVRRKAVQAKPTAEASP
jgi:RimJ/RimL family protein N-acetyltransferase